MPIYLPWINDLKFQKLSNRAYDLTFPDPKDKKFIRDDIEQDIPRRYAVYSLAKQALNIDGHFLELGVHHGTNIVLLADICDEVNHTSDRKAIYAVDSFEGLSAPKDKDLSVEGFMEWKKHSLKVDEEVPSRLRSLTRSYLGGVHVVKGWIPDVLSTLKIEKLSFVIVDVDLYEPTKACIEYAYPLLSVGGIMFFDDYAIRGIPGAKLAVDEFLEDKRETLLTLFDGYTFIIKI